uniref:DUF4347 domain-containing protein n=1 Tax=Chlorobium chlorochromatii (strain CaD3) TaxID=340177 RepID=Q3ARR6_CHLCH
MNCPYYNRPPTSSLPFPTAVETTHALSLQSIKKFPTLTLYNLHAFFHVNLLTIMATNSSSPLVRRELFIFDASVSNLSTLSSALSANSSYFVLDSTRDGLVQIADLLAGQTDIDSLHIFSHGSAGSLQLGNSSLSLVNLNNYELPLSVIGSSLSSSGDILLYGCNVGAGDEGLAFVDKLAKMTGADVAASDDLTGATALGGDCELEVESGVIDEASFYYAPEYAGLLGAVGPEFHVDTSDIQVWSYEPSVAALANGGFVVTWISETLETLSSDTHTDIHGQLYNSEGAMVGSEFQVNTYTQYGQYTPSITALADGGFVVTWISETLETLSSDTHTDIHGQLYNSEGAMVGSEFQVNTYTQYGQYTPSITALADGGFVIIWRCVNNDDYNCNYIHGQRYNADGIMVGSEFQVNTYTQIGAYEPSVAALADGGFVVTWESGIVTTWKSGYQDTSNSDIYGQIFNVDGAMVGSEFRINTYTKGFQGCPSVTSLTN